MGFQDARKKCIFYSGYICSVGKEIVHKLVSSISISETKYKISALAGWKIRLGSQKNLVGEPNLTLLTVQTVCTLEVHGQGIFFV